MVRIVLAALLTGWLTAAASSPVLATESDPLAGWTAPSGWTLQSDQASSAADLVACASGSIRTYTDAGDDRVVVERVVCADVAQAVTRQAALWAVLPRSSRSVVSALGAEQELDTATSDLVSRQWTQGRYGMQVVAFCGSRTTFRCDAASAAWVRAISSAGPAVAAVLSSRSAQRAPLQRWRPDRAGYWRSVGSAPDRHTCPGWAVSAWASARRETLTLASGDCGGVQQAMRAETEVWTAMGATSSVGASSAFDGADHVGWTVVGRVAAESRAWVQGGRLVVLVLTCPTGSAAACDRSSKAFARSLSALLPNDPPVAYRSDRAVLEDFVRLVVTLPLSAFLLLVVPGRVVDLWRGRGWSAQGGRRFTAVDAPVRRTRGRWALRRGAVFVVAFVLSAVLARSTVGLDGGWYALVVLLAPFAVGAACAGIAGVLWKPPLLVRPPSGPGNGRRRALALVCRSTAFGLLALALAAYFLLSVLANELLLQSEVTTQAQIAMELAAPGLVAEALGVVTAFLDWTLGTNAFVVLFAVSLAVIALALLLDRFGRRLQRLDLATTLQHDPRPYFLYLRGFDEDALRIREVAGRVGLLEVLAPVSRARFEEVLVERLAHFGPVIAIAPRKARVADLGAAKASFADDRWQERVEEYAGGARAIVMSATPGRIGEGLDWEIRQVSEHRDDLTLLLVLAPWPRNELLRRWRGFLDHVADLPPFDGIRDLDLPDGVQVLTWTAAAGWRGYGARRRWDWTYAASLVSAMQDLEVAAREPQVERPVAAASQE